MMDSITKISKFRLMELNEEVNNEKQEIDERDKLKNKKSDEFAYEDKNYNFNYNNYNFTEEKNKLLNKNIYTPNRYESDYIYPENPIGSSMYDIKMRNRSTESIHVKTPDFNYSRVNKDSRFESVNEREREREREKAYTSTSDNSKSRRGREYLNNINRENYEYSNFDKHSDSMKLEKQISELQVTINELQKKNSMLNSQLAESKHIPKKREFDQNDFIIRELKSIFNTENTEDILLKVRDSINREKNHRIKEELVDKLTNLYCTLSDGKLKECIDIKTLWRWIKNIIYQVQTKNGINIEVEKEYKHYWQDIMREYNLKDFRELQNFINKLLEKNAKNQKRVEKIKQILSVDPTMQKVIPGQEFYQ